MFRGIRVFSVPSLMKKIKKLNDRRNQNKIDSREGIEENMNEDNTNIEMLLNISYCLKTFRLVMIIVNVSFFIGTFWLIFIDVIDHHVKNGKVTDLLNDCDENKGDLFENTV